MSKIGIIIQREYLSRVTKRSFILTTIGLPLLIVLFYVVMGFIVANNSNKLNIAVIDESGIYANKLETKSKEKKFIYFKSEALDTLLVKYAANNFEALLHIKPHTINEIPDSNIVCLYTKNNLGLGANSFIQERLDEVYKNKILLEGGLNSIVIDSIRNISIPYKTISASESNVDSTVAFAIGQGCGTLLYIIILVYGTMVMRGVMEEKTNRIAEVMVSSVTPKELMMGKVIGIALVGLTQFIIWVLFILFISFIAALVLPSIINQDTLQQISDAKNLSSGAAIAPNSITSLLGLHNINWPLIGISFFLYFIGGYFLYASLFAAIGSLVNDDAQEAQSMSLPVTMPIIIAFLIGIQAAKDPNSSIAIFGSLFPLTSPIVMMARIAYNPPIWQIILSILLLFGTFIFITLLAAKIYKVGILMYGKKPSWKEVWKWMR